METQKYTPEFIWLIRKYVKGQTMMNLFAVKVEQNGKESLIAFATKQEAIALARTFTQNKKQAEKSIIDVCFFNQFRKGGVSCEGVDLDRNIEPTRRSAEKNVFLDRKLFMEKSD